MVIFMLKEATDLRAHTKYPCTVFCLFFFSLILFQKPSAAANDLLRRDTTAFSSAAQALALLDKNADLQPSNFWPNITPKTFLQNIRKNIENPLSLYEGRSTNFCAYAALSYLPLHDDPLGYASFLLRIYQDGKALYRNEYFEPHREVRQAAGTLSFKGELDIRPADQLWFLTLADHFKGYLNFFDKQYNPGDENKTWAAVNFAKFNRMIRRLFHYRVDAVGSDLVRPGFRDAFDYLSGKLQTGTVALFLNNLDLYKKSHLRIRLNIPTHFVILLNIEETEDGRIAITYWDYGGRTRQVLPEPFLKKIIFGVSHIQPKKQHE